MDNEAWQRYFGCKNHIGVTVGHKLIRGYRVTAADVHDSRVFELRNCRAEYEPGCVG